APSVGRGKPGGPGGAGGGRKSGAGSGAATGGPASVLRPGQAQSTGEQLRPTPRFVCPLSAARARRITSTCVSPTGRGLPASLPRELGALHRAHADTPIR